MIDAKVTRLARGEAVVRLESGQMIRAHVTLQKPEAVKKPDAPDDMPEPKEGELASYGFELVSTGAPVAVDGRTAMLVVFSSHAKPKKFAALDGEPTAVAIDKERFVTIPQEDHTKLVAGRELLDVLLARLVAKEQRPKTEAELADEEPAIQRGSLLTLEAGYYAEPSGDLKTLTIREEESGGAVARVRLGHAKENDIESGDS